MMIGATARNTCDLGMIVLALVAGVGLGCKAKAKAPPVAAAPIARPEPAAEPLSSPQTTVHLPPSQPIPPGAVPPDPPTLVPVPKPSTEAAEQAPAPPSRTRPAATPAARSSPPPPASPPQNSTPQLKPLLTAKEERVLRNRIERSLAMAEQSLARIQREPPNKDRQTAAERVRDFIDRAQQARRQGDLEGAGRLAERAELLAAELAKTSR